MFSKFILTYGFIVVTFVAVIIYVFRDFVGAQFSKDPLVIEQFLINMPYLAVLFVFDCIHATQLGVIKGLGL